jgi:hypothetical protein
MRETYRPFSKYVSITGGTAVEVTLHDSSGVALECNYIDLTSKVKISHDTTGTIAYAVRYGVVQMANNLKDSRSTRGN